MAGTRISLLAAAGATALALLLGAGLGLAAEALGRWPSYVVYGAFDLVRAMPSVLLALTLMVALGSGLAPLVLALGIAYAPLMAQVARAAWRRESAAGYVAAARVIGAAPLATLARHVLPNIAGALVTQAAIVMPRAITTESVLSFFGLGVSPETPSWGRMIAGATRFVEAAPHAVIFPVLALCLATLGFALAGDRLRLALDPLRAMVAMTRAVSAAGVGLLRQALLLSAITLAVFLLIRVVPGDVVDAMALEGSLDDDAIAELRADLGLDADIATQFRLWAGRALLGDFGLSLRFERPVADLILAALPTTLTLSALALSAGLVLGIALPTAAVLWPRSPLPALVEALNLWSIALPTFCVGLAGILVFSVWLGWLPVIGQMLLPVLILGIDIAGQIAKPLHEDLKEAATAAHIRTARAKGLSPARIVLRHLLPNALSTAIALAGLILAGLIGGALTMEVLFGLPGLGSLAFQAISGRDYPVIQAVVLVFAIGVAAVNLLADQTQRLLDPRLRS